VPRVGAFRFCRSCQFDFEGPPDNQQRQPALPSMPVPPAPASQPPPQPPAAGGGINDASRTLRLIGGIAWLACAALIAYLGLVQLGYVGTIVDNGSLQATGMWNLVAAAITMFFGARLLTNADRGFLGTSAAWAALTVLWQGYQIANGATNEAYVAATVAALVAGVVSYAARSEAPTQGAPTPGPAWPAAPVAPPVAPSSAAPITTPEARAPGRPATPQVVVASTAAAEAPRSGAWSSPGRATMIAAIAVLGVGAIAFAATQLGSAGPATPATATPPRVTAAPQPTKAPARTLSALPPGMITFGKATYAVDKPIDYTAFLNQVPVGDPLLIEILAGTETIGTQVMQAEASTVQEHAGTINIAGITPGSYLIRISSEGVVLAEGTVQITK